MKTVRAPRQNMAHTAAPRSCRTLLTAVLFAVALLCAGASLHADENTATATPAPAYEEAPWTVLIIPHGHSPAAAPHAVQFLGDTVIERHAHIVFGPPAAQDTPVITPGPESESAADPDTEAAPAPAPAEDATPADAAPAAPALPLDADQPSPQASAPQSAEGEAAGEQPPAPDEDGSASEALPAGPSVVGEPLPESWPIFPGHSGHGFSRPHHIDPAQYAAIYHSIPFSRVEYAANPSYRHDATMEILFGKLRPTTIHKHQTSREFTLAPPIVHRPGIHWISRYRRYRGLWGYTYLPPYLPYMGGYGPYTP